MAFRFPWNTGNKDNEVFLSYDKHRNNLGDILSPIIARHLGSKEVRRISKRNCRKFEHYFMIGSILQRCTSQTIIWGSGLISENARCSEIPKKVLAVRGPLTRKKLIEQGIECPEVYGDPALLLPEIYPDPNKVKKYKLGIIPHFKDKKDPWLKEQFSADAAIRIIDIQNKNPFKVVDEMLSCEKIVSSSLHGLIIADAYRIPSVWVEFEHPFEDGHFKFQDYFMSVGRSVRGPVKFKEFNRLADILEVFETYEIKIDVELLKKSFPF
jgi:pyruvyltransferase